MAQILKGRWVKGPCKPIRRDCTIIYFSITPPKMKKKEPEKHPFEKELHLPSRNICNHGNLRNLPPQPANPSQEIAGLIKVLLRENLGGGFKYFLFSPQLMGRFPFWLIFFRWVETTNQKWWFPQCKVPCCFFQGSTHHPWEADPGGRWENGGKMHRTQLR